MKATMSIRLYGRLDDNRSLRLWATGESGEPIPASELKLLMFARDPSTFYGAFADTWEDGPLSGILLSGGGLVSFFRNPPINPLVSPVWPDSLAPLLTGLAAEDGQPYRLAFALREPQDGHSWELACLLLDRRDPNVVVPLDGRGRPTGPLPEAWQGAENGAKTMLRAWLKLMPELASDTDPEALRTVLSDAEAWQFLDRWSVRLAEWGAEVLLPAWWLRHRRRRPKLSARIGTPSSGTSTMFGLDDLIRFNWRLSIGDAELTEEEFLAMAASGRHIHQVRGQWIALDPSLAEKIKQAMREARRRKGIPLRDILIDSLKKTGEDQSAPDDPDDMPVVEFEPEEPLARWISELANLGETAELPVPEGFRGELRPYQAKGFAWLAGLRRYGFGGCLADDMGLGKTVQYIAYLLHLLEKEPGGPSLLICPTSLIGNWQKELSRFAPSCRVLLHYGAGRAEDAEEFRSRIQGFDLVITTYMTALLDRDLLHSVRWHSLCLDEAQHLRNARTKQAMAIRRLPAGHRIALTGTPLENRPADLWSVIDYANPGYLGSLAAFEKQYGRMAASGRAAETLGRIVRPFLLRRMKTDPGIASDLPEKVESNIYVPLTAEQAALYEGVLERLWNGLEQSSGLARRGRILSAITRLKQICDHPSLYRKEGPDFPVDPLQSNKSAVLLDRVSELRSKGESCLIFTQYAAMGFLLKRMLEDALKEPVLYLHGGTAKAERERLVEQFREGGVFVLSLRAGGTGLNLTEANHVFHYDRWWNPAVENQATDRAHRIGQRRNVFVHKLIALGTLEEKIDELIAAKQHLMTRITQYGEQALSELGDGELREIIELRRNWIDG